MRGTVDSTGKTSVLPGMAKSVDQEEETKEGAITVTYTFRLRSARWSDGQPVTAGDFVYAWQRGRPRYRRTGPDLRRPWRSRTAGTGKALPAAAEPPGA